MPPDRTSDQGPRNSSWQGASCTSAVSHSFEHHTVGRTILLGSTPIFKENALGWSGASHLSSPSTHLATGLDDYLEYPHAAKALYIYKHPCLLRDLNPGRTSSQSASLTTIPNERHSGK
ncbi:uncharacterized protein TNCV_4009851 [Trichonephila clavipes]|nr:uncharacterized protein TNCV_4009851 [Trichonephila clavipes]